MRHIGDVVKSLQSEFQEKIDRAKEIERIRIRQHGWSEDVECSECGDSGKVPETGRDCYCAAGRRAAAMRARAEAWERNIPLRYRQYTLAGHPNSRARSVGSTWLKSKPWDQEVGANMVIMGPVGTGKTGLAIGLLREANLAGVQVLYTNVPDILTAMTGLKWEDKGRQMSRYQNVPLLLLDDLGAEHVKDWSAAMLYEVVEGRYRNGAPTIVTTNKSKREMREHVGDRVVSRVFDGAVELDLGGEDLRKRTHRQVP